MFKSIALTLLICCAAVTASAQIGMDLSLNRTNYMQYEPIYACVTLRNDTARPLLFGKHPKLQGYIQQYMKWDIQSRWMKIQVNIYK